MNSSNWKKLAFGAVILGLAAYGLAQLWGGPRAAVAQSDETELLPSVLRDEPGATPADTASEELRRRQQAIAAAPWPSNPFRSRSGTVAGPAVDVDTPSDAEELMLNGIISGTNPLAMVNGKVVGIGDRLGSGIAVIAIDDSAITLATPDGQKTLRLPE